MADRLREQVAIVTGSTSGIGLGIAERFGEEGARVVVTGLPASGAKAVVDRLVNAGVEAIAVDADVGYPEQVDRIFAAAIGAFGRLDILVNNAGWATPVAHILEMDEQHWDTVIRTNLKSVYLCTSRALRQFVKQGGGGCVINMSSFGAVKGHRQMAAYDAAKGGLEAFTRTVALDMAPFGTRINAIGPGAIDTPGANVTAEVRAARAATVPLGRMGLPADIAGAAVFLASADAAYVSGQVVYVDGGMLAQLRSPQVDTPLPDSVRALLPQPGR